MQEILPFINNWFFPKQTHFETFAMYDVRVEGWFKGELLLLLDSLKNQHIINDFQREVSIGNGDNRNQIDFKVDINQTANLCELKAICISQAQGTPRNLAFYFRDDNVGLIKDFRKLDAINHSRKWVLGFVYPKPSVQDWQGAINQIPNNLRHWSCVSSPESYPEHFFISLWQSERAAAANSSSNDTHVI